MENNYFTILWWFLPYISMNRSLAYICLLLPRVPSHIPPHPIPLDCHRAPASGSLYRFFFFNFTTGAFDVKSKKSLCNPKYGFTLVFSSKVFFKVINFNCRIINLQYYGGFFLHTSTWISHKCTCAPTILIPPHTSLRIPSLWVVPAHQLSVPCFYSFIRWWQHDSVKHIGFYILN